MTAGSSMLAMILSVPPQCGPVAMRYVIECPAARIRAGFSDNSVG
jgi:hypothetical protein